MNDWMLTHRVAALEDKMKSQQVSHPFQVKYLIYEKLADYEVAYGFDTYEEMLAFRKVLATETAERNRQRTEQAVKEMAKLTQASDKWVLSSALTSEQKDQLYGREDPRPYKEVAEERKGRSYSQNKMVTLGDKDVEKWDEANRRNAVTHTKGFNATTPCFPQEQDTDKGKVYDTSTVGPKREHRAAVLAGYDGVPCRFCSKLTAVISGKEWACDNCKKRWTVVDGVEMKEIAVIEEPTEEQLAAYQAKWTKLFEGPSTVPALHEGPEETQANPFAPDAKRTPIQ